MHTSSCGAVYLVAPRQFETRPAPPRQPLGAGEVRLKMIAVGVCGSDIHYYRSGRIGLQKLEQPWILGHECTARILEVGPGSTGLSVGDRVAVDPLVHCGRCSQCTVGRTHTCLQQQFMGCPGQLPGSMQDEVVLPAHCCIAVSASMTAGNAVMAEPLAIALHAIEQGRKGAYATCRPTIAHQDVAVLGAGPVGLCVLSAALHQKARSVHVSEPLDYRRDMARALGATTATAPEQIGDAVQNAVPLGVDCVFDCAGEPEALDQALHLLKPGGTLVLVGIPEGNRISLDINQLRRKEISLVNVRRQNNCAQRAVHLLETGELDLDSVVTHQFPAARSAEAFELVSQYRDGAGKVLIVFAEQ